jgi:imidazole glycerol-phosphate synthase subunit HisF
VLKKRLVACLLIRDGLIVQSIGFKRYLPIGRPQYPIEFVARWDVDEIVLLDISATQECREPDTNVLELLSQSCFVPLTVGGGIKSVDDVRRITRAGADKAAVNAHAVARPKLVSEIADVFGSQCVVVSIDCRRERDGHYQVYTHSGSRPAGLAPEAWAKQAETLGAGEIFLNSIDRDGSKQGYDLELIRRVSDSVSIPVVACGGVGNYAHFSPGILEGGASAVAAANIFHYIEHSTILAKAHLLRSGVDIRLDSDAKYQGREFDEYGRLIMLSGDRLSDIEFKRGVKDFL